MTGARAVPCADSAFRPAARVPIQNKKRSFGERLAPIPRLDARRLSDGTGINDTAELPPGGHGGRRGVARSRRRGPGGPGPDAPARSRAGSARDGTARHPGRKAQDQPASRRRGGRPGRPPGLPPLPLRPRRAGRQQVGSRQAHPRLPRTRPAPGAGRGARPPEAPLEMGQRRQGVPHHRRGRHPRVAPRHGLLLLGLQRQHARPLDRGEPGRPRPVRRPQPPARGHVDPLPRPGAAQPHGRRRGARAGADPTGQDVRL